jgi:hypothetical protein
MCTFVFSCFARNTGRTTPGAGTFDGEACERIHFQLSQLAQSCKRMTSLHYYATICTYITALNTKRNANLGGDCLFSWLL